MSTTDYHTIEKEKKESKKKKEKTRKEKKIKTVKTEQNKILMMKEVKLRRKKYM